MQEDRAYICRLIDCYSGALSERQRDVTDLYYNEDLSLAEIGENCGITRQGARDAILHGVTELYKLEEKLGFVAKGERISALAAEIARISGDSEVKRLADKITGEL